MKWVMDTYRWVLEVIKRSDTAQGFVLLPRRWVVKRTYGIVHGCRIASSSLASACWLMNSGTERIRGTGLGIAS